MDGEAYIVASPTDDKVPQDHLLLASARRAGRLVLTLLPSCSERPSALAPDRGPEAGDKS